MNELIQIIERFNGKRILLIGDLMLDKYVWGSVNRISPEAPVQIVNVKKESYVPGGAGNAANNAATLGGKVHLVGRVGDDEAKKILIEKLNENGITTQGVVTEKKIPTIQKVRVIAHNQQLLRVDYEDKAFVNGENEKKIIEYINKTINEVGVVVISDYSKGIITESLCREIIDIAKKNKKPVIVDPKPKNIDYYKDVELITPNYHEANIMLGTEDEDDQSNIEEIGKQLIKKLNSNVLITRGEKGMSLFEKNGPVTHISTKAKEVYDVSGAGDTVIAALAMSIAGGAALKQAAIIANHAAGITVGKIGTSVVKVDELKKALEDDE